jgi:hypothetical protein
VDARLDQSTAKGRQGIRGVDGDCSLLGSDPFPLSRGIEDLKSNNRLWEKQRHRSQVRVTEPVVVSSPFIFLCTTGCIVQIVQMVLSSIIVPVIADQLILIW